MVRIATTAKFPTTLAALADIGLFTNDEDCVLTADITSAATTVTIDDASAFAVGMWVPIRGVNGLEIVQVTAVSLSPPQLTVTRGKDGTTAIAHVATERGVAAIPAIALNQLRDEVIAIETFLGINGACVHWDRGLELEPSTDTCAILTLNLRSARTNKRFVQFSVDDVETGSIRYDSANDAVEFQGIRVDIGTGSDLLLEDDRILRFGNDSDLMVSYDSGDNRVEFRGDVDSRWQTSGGTEAVTIDPDTAVISNVLVRARTDNATDLGSAAVRWRRLYLGPTSLHVLAASADANAVLHAGSAGFQMGLGGASALDTTMARQAASVYEVTGSLAGSVRFGMSGAATPFIALRGAAADAQPLAHLLTDRIAWGLGGASAPDAEVLRGAANRVDTGAGDSFNIGNGGTFLIDATIVFEADRDVAISLLPNAAATLDLGSTTRTWNNVWARIFNIDNQGAGADVVLQANNAAQRANLAGHFDPSADSTWDFGTNLVRWANGYFDTLYSGLTAGSVVFAGTDGVLSQDNANLFWNDTNNRLGIGTASPSNTLHVKNDAALPARIERNQAGGTLAAIALYQPNTTDGNSLSMSYRMDTTGAGAAADTELAAIRFYADVHDHATRAGRIAFLISNGGAAAERMILDETGQLQISATGSSAGLLIGGSGLIYSSAADVVSLGADAFAINGTILFEADRDLAVSLIPNADNTLDLGSAAMRFNEAFSVDFRVLAAASDANPTARLNGAGVSFGAGGANAIDLFAERVAPTANKLLHIGATAGGATGVWVDVTNSPARLILQSPDNNYWGLTVDNTGAVTTTSIGASLP